MKKLLFVNNNLHIGGVQKALVSLLWSICDRYDITLLLFADVGACRQELPPSVKVITIRSGYRYLGMSRSDARSIKEKLARAFYAGITRLLGRSFAVRLMGLGQPALEGYDVAISYLHNGADRAFYGGCNEFVRHHVSAPRKLTFLHGDFQLCGANTPKNTALYAAFDGIAACSQGCANSLLMAHPHLADRVTVVENCHSFQKIREKADLSPVRFSADKIHIITVARLGKEKGVERALQAIAMLGPQREKLHYHIIGDGVQRPVLQQLIEKEQLQNAVTLYGMRENPYGHIRAADALLIPSYSEAAPLVIAEAACLGTPILSTQTSSAREMIEARGFGWVCDNTLEGLLRALQMLLTQPDKLTEAQKQLELVQMDNRTAVDQFIQIIEA